MLVYYEFDLACGEENKGRLYKAFLSLLISIVFNTAYILFAYFLFLPTSKTVANSGQSQHNNTIAHVIRSLY